MIKFLYNINERYDGFKEPNRFLLFMAMIVPAILLSSSDNAQVAAGSMLYILAMLVVRVLYIEGYFKKYLDWRTK